MDTAQIKQIIKRELPAIMREDAEIQQLVLQLAQNQFADKAETESRFDRLLAELRQDREAQEEKWKAQEKKWDENQSTINRLITRIDSSIGALGARWGIRSEQSFRNALKSILEESFDIEVLNIVEFDDEGLVFGQPDQVEMDITIKNGLLIICEINSSMSRSDMYTFGRKVSFYEKRHNKTATRKLVISPWVDDHARRVAKKLGVEVYSHADEIERV